MLSAEDIIKHLKKRTQEIYKNSGEEEDVSDRYILEYLIYNLVDGDDAFDVGPIHEVSHGGLVGDGDYYKVFYFVDHDVYLKIKGIWSSYNDVEFYEPFEESIKQVFPSIKTITVYE